MQTRKCRTAVLGLMLAAAGVALGDSYRVLALRDLEITGEAKDWTAALDTTLFSDAKLWMPALRCQVEGYLAVEAVENDRRNITQNRLRLAVRLKDEAVVEGFVDLMMPGGTMREFPFKLDPAKIKANDETEFAKIRNSHFARLSNNHLPGTAWFRHMAGAAADQRFMRDVGRRPTLEDSFTVFSGGRAVSENLALDRDLVIGAEKPGTEPVALKDIQGVTVKKIDWTGKLPTGKTVAVDALALAIPVDQHALFAPSMEALFELTRVAEDEGMPALQGLTVRNPFRTLIARYRAQMGLDLPDALARLLPVNRVAVTGGDPFFPTGCDVALLFETKDAAALHAAILAAVKAKAMAKGAAESEQSGEGYVCKGYTNKDRSFSSYVMRAGDLVAVTNSPAQVTRLMAVRNGAAQALGTTDEFRFFRHRYPLGEQETALVFLSDETIRRWAGPTTRIAASRRARAGAALMELSARMTQDVPLGNDFNALLGKVEKAGDRVWSENFGTLGFVTPVAEMEIKMATAAEKSAYEQWRRGYESGWAKAFDPIAIRLTLSAGRRGLDMTVLPLTVDSQYNDLIDITGKARLSQRAKAVPQEAQMFFSMAVDRDSAMFRHLDQRAISMLPEFKINPLSWMGDSISLWLEDGVDLEMLKNAGVELFTMLPVVLRVESSSSLKLAIFLTAIKSAMNSSAPGLVTWESRKHGEQSYVRIQGDEKQSARGITMCYAAMKDALLLALDEEVLKRAINRENAVIPAAMAEKMSPARHLFAEATPGAMQAILGLMDVQSLLRKMQEESWKAIPVLNEWHRRQPAADPAKLEWNRFASDVYCPGGKGYRWNARAMTMESVAYGFPAAPREDGELPALLTKFQTLGAGLDFEDGGLRARAFMGPVGNRVPAVVKPPGALLGKAADFVNTDPKRRLVYDYLSPDGSKKSRTFQPRDVTHDGNAVVLSIEIKEEERTWTETYRMDGDLRALAVGGEDSKFKFKEGTPVLPGDLREGALHQSSVKGKWIQAGKEQDCVLKTIIRVIGRERVEVPAGAFEDCVRIEVLTRYIAEGLHQQATPVTYWLHKNTGVVKSEARSNSGLYSTVLVKTVRDESPR